MDVSLIYPPLALEARYGRRKLGKVGGHLPPLGLLCLAAMLRQEGFSAGIIDGPAEELDQEALIAGPIFIPFGYQDAGEIRRMQRRAFLRFYCRPKYLWRRLLKIKTAADLYRCFKGLRVLMGFARA